MLILQRVFLNEWVIVWAILGNSVVLFLLGFDDVEATQSLGVFDHIFTIFFFCEIIVKSISYGWRNYISDGWNKFDVALVLISSPSLFEVFINIPDFSYLLVFRLLRVFRILRFMRFIPNISQMIAGIRRAIRASIFILVSLFIYNVLLAVLSSYLFRELSPKFFGNPLTSMYSIFQIFTLEGWHEIPQSIVENIEVGSVKPFFVRIYFLIIVLTGGIFGFSIVNAVFVDEMISDNNDDLEGKVDRLSKKIDQLLKNQKDKE